MLGSTRFRTTWAMFALLLVAGASAALAQDAQKSKKFKPITIVDQGSFMVGGSVIRAPGTFDPERFPATPDGQTFHGDHAYVQYQVPANARALPLVMWHGGGQFSKTWETTPDGREGFQTIFLRRGWPVYILDQPRRGRAGRSTEGITITPTPAEMGIFSTFRLGVWPNFFPGVSFSRDPEALNQYWRQQTPNTGPSGVAERDLITDPVAALFNKIGPGVLLTHSASGILGWLTAMKSSNVKAIISYEPAGFAFPEGEVPPPVVTARGTTSGTAVSAADFAKLTKIPIQIVMGDYFPTSPSLVSGLDLWYRVGIMAAHFRDAVNRHGGNVTLVYLADVGLRGNTHFPFSDLNNLQVADLLSKYLREQGLDKRK